MAYIHEIHLLTIEIHVVIEVESISHTKSMLNVEIHHRNIKLQVELRRNPVRQSAWISYGKWITTSIQRDFQYLARGFRVYTVDFVDFMIFSRTG